jgi:hypothetical protein
MVVLTVRTHVVSRLEGHDEERDVMRRRSSTATAISAGAFIVLAASPAAARSIGGLDLSDPIDSTRETTRDTFEDPVGETTDALTDLTDEALDAVDGLLDGAGEVVDGVLEDDPLPDLPVGDSVEDEVSDEPARSGDTPATRSRAVLPVNAWLAKDHSFRGAPYDPRVVPGIPVYETSADAGLALEADPARSIGERGADAAPVVFLVLASAALSVGLGRRAGHRA